MDWLGSSELQFILVIFGVMTIGIGSYSYYHGRLSRSELVFILVGSVAWIAYAIEGTAAFLSVPQFVSGLLATVAGISFIGLFLFWAYSQ